jgi:hypothetical protein
MECEQQEVAQLAIAISDVVNEQSLGLETEAFEHGDARFVDRDDFNHDLAQVLS